MSEPDPARWKAVRFKLVKAADGTITGEMIQAGIPETGNFRSWVRGWRRDAATGDIVCEVQERPAPEWEAWMARQDALLRSG